MVLTAGGKKENVGLSLKFEAKALKVIDYSRKNDRFWEFSQKTVDLIKNYKVHIQCSPHRDFISSMMFRQAKFPQIFRRLDSGGDGKLDAVIVVFQ